MRSRASFFRFQSVEEIRASLGTFGPGIAENLQKRRETPPGEGEASLTSVNYQAVFDDLEVDLGSVQSELVQAEDKHVRKLIRVSKLRRLRDELTSQATDRLVTNRRVLVSAFGPGRGFEVAALSGKTPREYKTLIDQIDQTVQLLREPEGELPVVIADGVQVDLEEMATAFEKDLSGLRAMGSRLERGRKAAAETLIAKNKALQAFNSVFPPIARVVEGFFSLAGEPDLAEKVRTSARRVTRRQGDGDGEEQPEEVGSGEGSPDSQATEDGVTPSATAEPASSLSAS